MRGAGHARFVRRHRSCHPQRAPCRRCDYQRRQLPARWGHGRQHGGGLISPLDGLGLYTRRQRAGCRALSGRQAFTRSGPARVRARGPRRPRARLRSDRAPRHVGRCRIARELAGQRGIGGEFAGLIELPDLVSVIGLEQLGAARAKVVRMFTTSRSSMRQALLLPAALTACGRSMITGRRHPAARCTRTGRHGSAAAKHQYDLRDHEAVPAPRLFRAHFHFVEPRCRVAMLVDHQFHQQDASCTPCGLGSARLHGPAGRGPGSPRSSTRILHLAAIASALADGARIAAAARLAASWYCASLWKPRCSASL